MADDPEFAQLLSRLQAGDQDAATELVHHFAGRLAILASRRLGPLALGKVDPEEIVQSVFKSFFNRQAQGLFQPEGWGALWVLLTTITLHKCGHKLAYLRAACRDVRREVNPDPASSDLSDPGWNAIAREPTPAQAALLADLIERLEQEMEPHHRDIFRLRLQGYSPSEIAEQLKLSERTVQRVLKRIRDKLEGLVEDKDES